MSVHARVVVVVGLALAAAGLVLGLLPVPGDMAGCGSPFQPADTLSGAAVCGDRLAAQRVPAVELLVVGGALALAGLVLFVTDPAKPAPAGRVGVLD